MINSQSASGEGEEWKGSDTRGVGISFVRTSIKPFSSFNLEQNRKGHYSPVGILFAGSSG